MAGILSERFAIWLSRRHALQKDSITLDRRRIYILPTKAGYAFFVVLFVMFLWAVNYTNSLAFVLTFLLGAVVLNAMWRAHANLLQLQITPHHVEPVFAGQAAQFRYSLQHPDQQIRYSIALQWLPQEPVYADIAIAAATPVELLLVAEQRGRLVPERIRISTRFPLGLFQAWSWLRFDQFCLVYPKPQGQRPLPLPSAVQYEQTGANEAGLGSDDYAGLRQYINGDSPRHVAWKASARRSDDGLLVKRFSGRQRPELWLDWEQLPELALEQRLSQLCQWLLKAEQQGYDYGLRLPGVELTIANGEAHQRRCLQALALFELKD